MAVSYFTTNSWVLKNYKLMQMWTQVPTYDRMHFCLNEFENLDILEFYRNAIWGARLYLLKEGADTFPHARRHYIR
jgi:hypothetical protein